MRDTSGHSSAFPKDVDNLTRICSLACMHDLLRQDVRALRANRIWSGFWRFVPTEPCGPGANIVVSSDIGTP